MGGLAHIIEEEGIPTTQISLIRTHTEKMKPPRALTVPFELGRPLGAPNEPEFQRRVLLEVLKLLEKPAGPVLEDFPDPPPDAGADDDTEGWACPVNFAAPADDLGDADLVYRSLLQEVNLLRPWYEEAVKSFKRSAFGVRDFRQDAGGDRPRDRRCSRRSGRHRAATGRPAPGCRLQAYGG